MRAVLSTSVAGAEIGMGRAIGALGRWIGKVPPMYLAGSAGRLELARGVGQARPALDWRVTVGGMPEEAVAVGELRWRPQGGLRGAVRELRQRPQGGSRWRHSVRETCNWRDSFNMDMVSCVPLSAWTASVNLLSLWTDYLEYSCMAEAQSG